MWHKQLGGGGVNSKQLPKVRKLSKTLLIENEVLSLPTKIDFKKDSKLRSFKHFVERHAAFTLAETLITLTILGVVAALTVPSLVRRQVEASNRVKIKKAVGVYDSMITKLTVQNNLKSNAAIQEWADDDCSNSSDLFKVVKFLKVNDVETKCKFKTADGVFWDITNIQKPIIALRERDLDDATAQSTTNRAFYLFAEFDGTGILRVTEPTYDYSLTADAASVNNSVDGLMDFLAGKATTQLNELSNSTIDNTGGEEGENEGESGGSVTGGNSSNTVDDFVNNYPKENISSADFQNIINAAKQNNMTVKASSSCNWISAYNINVLLSDLFGQKAYAAPEPFDCHVLFEDNSGNRQYYRFNNDNTYTLLSDDNPSYNSNFNKVLTEKENADLNYSDFTQEL